MNVFFLGLIVLILHGSPDGKAQIDRIHSVYRYILRSSHQYREVIYELGKPLTYKEFKPILESSVEDKTEIQIEDNVIFLKVVNFRFEDNKLRGIYIPDDYGDFD